MQTLTLSRNGSFSAQIIGPSVCGPVLEPYGNSRRNYQFKVDLCVRGTVTARKPFVLEQSLIQKYFDDRHPAGKRIKGVSCERMAQRACKAIRTQAEKEGWKVNHCSVKLSGNGGVSWIECTWREMVRN